ncbi:helix-turn-helix domain-containing protein [Microbacterium gubbeenense]|uniref:helix-turn-helix domain-containing protein n=1 Tax=Microbacterium gubbeenense TaxID=159896 RepID=UPI000414EF3C|nr:helix-turn-helix domain-containing protein [Microbacterium gubbeenense]
MTERRGPVLPTAKAAEYVGLKPQTLRKLRHLGQGPAAFKQGRLNVYYPADLDDWLADRLTPAT